jgi:hypothetical protein
MPKRGGHQSLGGPQEVTICGQVTLDGHSRHLLVESQRELKHRHSGNLPGYFGALARVGTADWTFGDETVLLQVHLISSQVLGGYIVLGDFFRVNFSYIWVGCIFHPADHFGLEGLAFLD